MVLAARDIEAGYGRRAVLAGVSCAIAPGRLTAILGPNGAGKSTLLRVLMGSLTPWRGEVSIDGVGLGLVRASDRARRLAFIPQSTAPDSPYAAVEVVRLGRVSIPEPSARALEAAHRGLKLVGLGDRPGAPLGSLSAGQQQRVLLARALAQLDTLDLGGGDTPVERGSPAACRYLLCDEPAASMDPRHALRTMDLLRAAARAGVGVGVVLHDFALASRFADHVLLLDERGRIVRDAPAGEALDPEGLEALFGVRFESVRVGDGVVPLPMAPVEGPARPA